MRGKTKMVMRYLQGIVILNGENSQLELMQFTIMTKVMLILMATYIIGMPLTIVEDLLLKGGIYLWMKNGKG